jgi:phosphoribosylglycinamide formyltransferase-1
MKIIVCSSGGGGNFKSLIEKSYKYKSYEISRLVVDRNCGAQSVAKDFGINSELICVTKEFANNLTQSLWKIDLVVLAGFMPIIPETVIKELKGCIINSHPSLLPKHGGIGMFGVRVQESVLKSGDLSAGCTVHQVTQEIDGGKILAQAEIPVPAGIDAWSLGGLVHDLECQLLPATVDRIARGEITLEL